MQYRYLTLLVVSLNFTHGIDIPNIIEKFTSILHFNQAERSENSIIQGLKKYFLNDNQDESDKEPPDNEPIFKDLALRSMPSKLTGTGSKAKKIKTPSPATPLPSSLKNRRLWQFKKKGTPSSSSSEVEELQFFMDDWGEKRLLLKFEALNSTEPRGDVVNMKSARPWGITCGDPNQHDLPWGTCTLAAECDAEFRIYRGDSFCGRTVFVCCGLMHTSYDLYQGLDLSLGHDNSLTTDTEEQKHKHSHEEKIMERKKRRQQRKKRRRDNYQLKKKIRDSIQNIITEITKLLQKAYRNGTSQRYLKTKEMVKFIKKMKEQYKKDRKTLVDAHELNMLKANLKLKDHLDKIYDVNENFLKNDTFRDIVVNGTVNREKLTQLQRTHPVLSLFFNNRRMGGEGIDPEPKKIKRRKEKNEEIPRKKKENRKVLEYDLEYGMLYY